MRRTKEKEEGEGEAETERGREREKGLMRRYKMHLVFVNLTKKFTIFLSMNI